MDEAHIEKLNNRYFKGNLDTLIYLDSIVYQIEEKAASQSGDGRIVRIQRPFISEAIELVAQIATRYRNPSDVLKSLDVMAKKYFEKYGNEATFVKDLKDLDFKDSGIMARLNDFLPIAGFRDRANALLLKEKRYVSSGNIGISSGRVPLDEDSFGYLSLALKTLEETR